MATSLSAWTFMSERHSDAIAQQTTLNTLKMNNSIKYKPNKQNDFNISMKLVLVWADELLRWRNMQDQPMPRDKAAVPNAAEKAQRA